MNCQPFPAPPGISIMGPERAHNGSKKETRNADVRRIPLRKFLAQYNTSDVYTVTDISPGMMRDVELMPFLTCGGFTNLLDMVTMWMSSGGTRSVLHNDDQDNINCLFAGKKRMIFWHPKYRSQITSAEYGWHDQNTKPIAGGGYGAFAKFIDVDAVDLVKYPGWTELEWYDGDMEPGDCLFIPHKWYHTVASFERNLAINVWWWRNNANGRNTQRDVSSVPNEPFSDMQCRTPARGKDGNAAQLPFRLHDCNFGYEFQPPGEWRRTRTEEHTSCARGKAARGGASIRITDQGQPDQADEGEEEGEEGGEGEGVGEGEGDSSDQRDADADDDDEDSMHSHGDGEL